MDNIPNQNPIINTQTSPDQPQPTNYQDGVIANSTPIKKSSRNKKVIATLLGTLVLMGGIGAGILLSQRSLDIREKAATEQIENRVTATPANLHQENAETQQRYPENATSQNISFVCSTIDIYTVNGDLETPTNWHKLTSSEINNLKSGDVIYFVVDGSETSGYGSIDKAKFIVNNQEYEGTRRNTGIMCAAMVGASCKVSFYLKYTIPSNVNSFKVEAKLHHSQEDKWF